MRAHIFDSTGEAYDEVQCSDDIKSGDILIITSEKVIGIADTWPFALSKEHGKLHTVAEDFDYHLFPPAYHLPIKEAKRLVEELGW